MTKVIEQCDEGHNVKTDVNFLGYFTYPHSQKNY